MMQFLTRQDIAEKRVLVRVDLNVPFAEDGKTIADDFRIRSSLSTIHWLQERKAKIVLMSHLGRPEGGGEKQLSLKSIAGRLSEMLKRPVALFSDVVGDDVEDDVLHMRGGDIAMLENLRFHEGEKNNDVVFAKKLARLGDIYVNDAFGVSHRAHASVSALAGILPAYAGSLLEKEVSVLSALQKKPKKPLMLVIGGAKIETKLPVIKNFLKNASAVLVGGAIANTFLAAKGYRMGASKLEPEFIPAARKMLKSKKIILPSDAVASANPHGKRHGTIRGVSGLGAEEMMLDIGPETAALFSAHIKEAGTVVWNGPMGLFEIDAFRYGTIAVARAMANSSAYKVVGGGETGVEISRLGIESKFDHISTGGGAMLEFLGGKKLPGLEALGYYI